MRPEMKMDGSIKNYLIQSELFQALTANFGMQHLVNTASRIIGNPIGIMIGEDAASYLSPDMPRNVMMIVKCSIGADPDCCLGEQRKLWPENVVLRENGFQFLSGEGQRHDILFAPLAVNEATVGYFSIALSGSLLSESDSKSILLIQNVFQLALKTDIGAAFLLKNNKTKLLECLLNEGRSFLSTSALREELGLQKNKILQMITAVNAKSNTRGRTILQIRETLSEQLNSELYLIKNESILFLCSNNLKEKSRELSNLMDSLGLCAGVSYPFEKLEEIKGRVRQAEEALSIGREKNPGSNLHFFEDYVIHKITRDLPNREFKGICHPAARKIYDYDRQNNTYLLRTLVEYFSNQRNLGVTAGKLGIHRNTILQRLNKIADLTSSFSLCADSLYYLYLSSLLLDIYAEPYINTRQ